MYLYFKNQFMEWKMATPVGIARAENPFISALAEIN